MARIITDAHPILRDAKHLELLVGMSAIALRLYIAMVWLRFGITKFQADWLTTNPLRQLLTMVGAGQLPWTVPGYSLVARMLVATHGDAVLSVLIPCTEVVIGLAMLAGFRVRAAALLACALNVNLILAGVASVSLDGRMIVLQLILAALVTLRG